jgi:hypothetical protein
MSNTASLVDLGFVSARVPSGSHVCQIYSDGAERDNALVRFLAHGLQANESTACFSENLDPTTLRAWFEQEGLSLDNELKSGRCTLSGAKDVYFRDDQFDPERLYSLLTQFHEDALAQGRAGARVIGEMSAAITKIAGGSRLFEYEAGVNTLLCTHPITAVCQYDARVFDGATIMDVLTVHPLMVVQGNVIQNPFFIPAEDYTGR